MQYTRTIHRTRKTKHLLVAYQSLVLVATVEPIECDITMVAETKMATIDRLIDCARVVFIHILTNTGF